MKKTSILDFDQLDALDRQGLEPRNFWKENGLVKGYVYRNDNKQILVVWDHKLYSWSTIVD